MASTAVAWPLQAKLLPSASQALIWLTVPVSTRWPEALTEAKPPAVIFHWPALGLTGTSVILTLPVKPVALSTPAPNGKAAGWPSKGKLPGTCSAKVGAKLDMAVVLRVATACTSGALLPWGCKRAVKVALPPLNCNWPEAR